MSFISTFYLVFLAFAATGYYLMPAKGRTIWLLLISWLFYFSLQPAFLLILFGSTLTAFFIGSRIGGEKNQKRRKNWLILGVAFLLCPLIFFKYFAIIDDRIHTVVGQIFGLHSVGNESFLVPLGISFFTFQGISYLADIYRNYLEPEKKVTRFALYMSFFPTLLAGPIERAKSTLTQFKVGAAFDYNNVVAGLQLILWGVFKKVVIADRLAEVINLAYAKPEDFPGVIIYLVICLSVFQIFCDFSGYSDIAVGTARIFGIQLSKNFDDRVYAATSREIFWQGWHRSLTSWLRDYVFFPLSKGVKNRGRLYLNLIIVYLLVGVWHGPSWGFVVWGFLNGAWLVMENVSKESRERLFESLKVNTNGAIFGFFAWLLVFHVGAFFGVFFRTQTPAEAFAFLGNILNSNFSLLGRWETMRLLMTLGFIVFMDLINRRIGAGQNFDSFIGRQAFWLRWLLYFVLSQMIMRYIEIPSSAMFSYFRY